MGLELIDQEICRTPNHHNRFCTKSREGGRGIDRQDTRCVAPHGLLPSIHPFAARASAVTVARADLVDRDSAKEMSPVECQVVIMPDAPRTYSTLGEVVDISRKMDFRDFKFVRKLGRGSTFYPTLFRST